MPASSKKQSDGSMLNRLPREHVSFSRPTLSCAFLMLCWRPSFMEWAERSDRTWKI